MGGKQRTIHILEPYLLGNDGTKKQLGPGFWKLLLDRIEELDAAQRVVDIRSIRHRGTARTNVSPALRYLYIGKRRPQQDWPDTAKGDSDEMPLMLDGDLVEPLYILPVPNHNYAAFMKSSGGPSFSAAAEWIARVGGFVPADSQFELRPYVRTDDLARLRSSVGLTQLDLKFDPGADLPGRTTGQGKIVEALQDLRDTSGGSVSISLKLSFGNAIPDEGTALSFARQLDTLLGSSGISRAKATALQRDDDASLRRDHLDFIQDRVTYSVEVGRSQSEAQTPAVVLQAMSEGVDKFVKQLHEH